MGSSPPQRPTRWPSISAPATRARRRWQSTSRLQGLLRTPLPEDEVPERLWTAIHQRLVQELQATVARPARRPRHRLWLSLGALAALLLVALAVRLWLTPAVPLVVQEVVDSQIRARLMGVPYTQMPATPDAIRHWFDDKVDFAVLVPVLPQARYAFLGARLNYFLNRRVAEMAYASEGHVLSFVMFTDPGMTLSTMSPMRWGTGRCTSRPTRAIRRSSGKTARSSVAWFLTCPCPPCWRRCGRPMP